jgi:hypothetical protein
MMNRDISVCVKNRLSQSDFRKISFDESVDKFYYYGDYPVKRLPVRNDDFISYIITYYQCRKNDARVIYEEKNLRIDMYKDKYHIVDYDKLKSNEKVLFDSIVNDDYFKRLVYEDMSHTFNARALGLD